MNVSFEILPVAQKTCDNKKQGDMGVQDGIAQNEPDHRMGIRLYIKNGMMDHDKNGGQCLQIIDGVTFLCQQFEILTILQGL